MNDSQMAAIRVLRHRATTWLWLRWLLLATGIFLAAAGTYWSIELVGHMSELSSGAKDSPGFVVFLSSLSAAALAQLQIAAALGPMFIAWAIGKWRGDPAVTVLLGLVERSAEVSSTVA